MALMVGSLALVMLNSLQKRAPSQGNVFVLDRDHLIEVYSLSLILDLGLLVFKPHVSRAKGLEVVSCA